jgi:Domain of unknown function (DUF4365)
MMAGSFEPRRSTVQIEVLGVKVVGASFAGLGWFMREQTVPDQGIDAQVEAPTDKGRPSGDLIGLQIKSGPSYFKHSTQGGWWFYLDSDNLRYWLGYGLSVVVVLYEPSGNVGYWQSVEEQHLTRTNGNFKLFVPQEQVIGTSALPELERIARSGGHVSFRGARDPIQELRATYDRGLVELVGFGGELYVEVEEWLETESGRASLRVIADFDYESQVVRDWPTFYLRGADVGAAVEELFPWADVSIDEPTYGPHDELRWRAACCTWNQEYEDWDEAEEFDAWSLRELGDGLRAFAESADGQRSFWRLKLQLNALGRETLEREADDERWNDLLQEDRDERELELAHGGWYVGDAVEVGPGGLHYVERVVFHTEEDFDVLAAEEMLWTDEEVRPLAAAAILAHALGGPVSSATAALFVDRFSDVFENEFGEWSIGYSDVASWADSVGAKSLPARGYRSYQRHPS